MNKVNYIFLLLALLAEIIGTVGGFGSSVFFVPIGNFYFDFQAVLGLTAIFHLFSNLSKIFLFKHGLDKKLLINIGVPSVIFVIIGGLLTKAVDGGILEILLAFFLIGLSILFLYKKDLIILPNRRNSIAGGALSGFSAGLLGTGGAIRGLTMAAYNLEKSVFIATSAFIDFFIDFTRTFVYYRNGYIQKELLIYLPFLLVIGFVGTYLGKRILNYISQDKFKRISLVLILLIGLLTLINVLIQ
ncbi:sulfite exporter TauE/SafE family protein [Algoriphagus yeomjeoni]|uniref:sulfite exporter TauE/SafE family protein n=1 Tax=Algoriphagus yeomjeoni TaxID=291403 RepID=UPI003CE4A1A8